MNWFTNLIKNKTTVTEVNTWEQHPNWRESTPKTEVVVKKIKENTCPCCGKMVNFITGNEWYSGLSHEEQYRLAASIRTVQDFFKCGGCGWESSRKISNGHPDRDCGWQNRVNVGYGIETGVTHITSGGVPVDPRYRAYVKEEILEKAEYIEEKW